MPSFDTSGSGLRTPFGKNEFRRSTQDVKTESYMMAASGIPEVTIDGVAQKVLQPGTVIVPITIGADAGKFGVLDSGAAADGRNDATASVGLAVTFLPWQLMERDVEISVAYEVSAVQAWCIEYVAGVATPLTNATRDILLAVPDLRLRFS